MDSNILIWASSLFLSTVPDTEPVNNGSPDGVRSICFCFIATTVKFSTNPKISPLHLCGYFHTPSAHCQALLCSHLLFWFLPFLNPSLILPAAGILFAFHSACIFSLVLNPLGTQQPFWVQPIVRRSTESNTAFLPDSSGCGYEGWCFEVSQRLRHTFERASYLHTKENFTIQGYLKNESRSSGNETQETREV